MTTAHGATKYDAWALEAAQGDGASGLTLVQCPHRGSTKPELRNERSRNDNVRADGLPNESTLIRQTIQQPLSGRLGYGFYDIPIHLAFNQAAWGAAHTTTGTLTISGASGNTATLDTSGAETADLTSFSKGDIVRVSGFTTNGAFWARLTSAPDANGCTCEASKTLSNEAAGDTVTVMHSGDLRPGTSTKTAVRETGYSGAGEYLEHSGVVVESMELTYSVESGEVAVAFQTRGMVIDRAGSSFGSSVTLISNASHAGYGKNVFRAPKALSLDGGCLVLGGSPVDFATLHLRELMISLASAANPSFSEGATTAREMGKNSYGDGIKARLGFRYSDESGITDLVDDAHDDSEVAFWGVIVRGSDAYAFSVPRLQLETGSPDDPGQDGWADVMFEGTCAQDDSGNGYPIYLARFASFT